MKFTRELDILFNIILPLCIGALIYYFADKLNLNGFIRNQLPDGLWAYAFLSMVLIVWNRTIHITWIIIVFLISIGFEILQYLHVIKGTGDIWDIITYFVFFGLALGVNKYILHNHTLRKQDPAATKIPKPWASLPTHQSKIMAPAQSVNNVIISTCFVIIYTF